MCCWSKLVLPSRLFSIYSYCPTLSCRLQFPCMYGTAQDFSSGKTSPTKLKPHLTCPLLLSRGGMTCLPVFFLSQSHYKTWFFLVFFGGGGCGGGGLTCDGDSIILLSLTNNIMTREKVMQFPLYESFFPMGFLLSHM